MVMNGALLLLSRSFCAALLMLVETKYFIWYSAFDMGLYLLQKVLRGDFTYWIPADGPLGFLVSVIMRVGMKSVTDYTGIVQFRASAELGGIYWTFNMLVAVAVPFEAVAFYFRTSPAVVVLAKETAWRIAGSLSGAWLVFFFIFLLLMKSEYRRSFFSFETGSRWAQAYFLEGKTDLEKAAMFTISMKKWKPVEQEAKLWVQDSWEGWEEEQPAWFTEVWKSRVPDDWLSAVELRRQKLAGGGQRRRSSLFGGLTSVTEKRGNTTVVPFNEEGVDVLGSDDDNVAAGEVVDVIE
jgi:hypothetical protein